MQSNKPVLLLYGATGATGKVVVEGLLHTEAFQLGVISRTASTPLLERWQRQGVVLHTIDVGTASPAALESVLKGVDFLVSVCSALALETQRPLFEAAKRAGVRRVVPSDFGPACPPGVTHLQDLKLGIRAHIRALGLAHTFVEIGVWAQFALPYPRAERAPWAHGTRRLYGAGDTPFAVTDLARVPELLVRILQDPRTEGQTVFCCEDEVTQQQVWAIAAREADEGTAILDTQIFVSVEQVQKEIADAKAAHDKDPSWMTLAGYVASQMAYTVNVRGDNTVEKAVAAGAMDARSLYPEFQPKPLAEYAKAWYRAPTAFPYGL